MTGATDAGPFVPMFDPPRQGKGSARVGWIVAANGCHLWQGSCDRKGYGRVRLGGITRRVHVVRYEREIGPIPTGTELDHYVCDGGPLGCCNPAHERPASHRENTLRGSSFAAENAAKTHCPLGHPYDDENTYVNPRGERSCRTCRRACDRRRNRGCAMEHAA